MADSNQTMQFLKDLGAARQQAIAEFYDRYYDRLKALSFRKMGAHIQDEPEDVAMSVMGSMIRGVDDGRFKFADSRKLWSLMMTIMLHKIYKRSREGRRGEFTPVEANEIIETGPGPEDAVIFIDLVETALKGLESPYPEILRMYLEGRTQDEMAKSLGITRGAVKHRYERIRDRLRRMQAESESVYDTHGLLH